MRNIIDLSHRPAADFRVRAIRLDSGDLLELARQSHSLSVARLRYVEIVASGELDEYKLQQFAGAEVPNDAYGLGTARTANSDAPTLQGFEFGIVRQYLVVQQYRGVAHREWASRCVAVRCSRKDV